MSLVEIERFHDPIVAELARARLEAAGIPAALFDAGLSALTGGALPGARLMVPDEHEAEARALLETLP